MSNAHKVILGITEDDLHLTRRPWRFWKEGHPAHARR